MNAGRGKGDDAGDQHARALAPTGTGGAAPVAAAAGLGAAAQIDLAIEGEGFFLIATPTGNQLTRAGAFTPGPDGTLLTPRAAEWFISFSMVVLAIQKLRDVESFSSMFLNYDLLARRWVRYGYLYPFGEGVAGVRAACAVAAVIRCPAGNCTACPLMAWL